MATSIFDRIAWTQTRLDSTLDSTRCGNVRAYSRFSWGWRRGLWGSSTAQAARAGTGNACIQSNQYVCTNVYVPTSHTRILMAHSRPSRSDETLLSPHIIISTSCFPTKLHRIPELHTLHECKSVEGAMWRETTKTCRVTVRYTACQTLS